MDILDVEETLLGMKLKKMSPSQRLCRFLSLCGSSASEQDRQRRLQEYVKKSYVSTPNLSSDECISFYKNLRKWSIFNPAELSGNVRESLSPDYKAARAAFRLAQLRFPDTPDSTRAKWNLKRAEVMLANELGVHFRETGSGANGALFGRGLDGRFLMVIKTSGVDSRPFFKTERIILQRPQPVVCKHDPRQAGAIAFMADEFFGFGGIVPPTYTDDQAWSMQTFVDDTYPADKARIKGKLLREIPPEELTTGQLESLQLKAVFNFILGDLDGKDDKLRLKFDEDGELEAIYETDNDNILPFEELNESDDGRTLTKTHQWKQHLWARHPFLDTPRLNGVLSNIFAKQNVDAFVEKVRIKYPEFWHAKRWDLLVERIATLQMVCEQGMTPADLGEFYSSKAPKSQQFRNEIDGSIVKFLSGKTSSQLYTYANAHPRALNYAESFDEDYKENGVFLGNQSASEEDS